MPLLHNEKLALAEFKEEILRRYEVVEVRLFGSKARGTDTHESDVDVMVLLRRQTPEIESAIDDLVFDVNLKHDCFITALCFSSEEIESGPMAASPIYRHIMAEGVRI